MAQIAGIQDFRQQGPPADIGTYVLTSTAVVFPFVFSGTTYYVGIRMGISGWVLLDSNIVPETVINTAFTTLGAGARIILLDTAYTLVALGISFTANSQVLEGQGRGSFIDGDALLTTIHAINISGFTDCTIKNLSVQTEDGGGKTCYCIFIEDGANRFRVEGVTTVNSDSHGIHIEGTTINGGLIAECDWIDTDGRSININMDGGNFVYRLKILGNTVHESGDQGYYLHSMRDSVVNGNILINVTFSAFYFPANNEHSTIEDNVIITAGEVGCYCSNVTLVAIIGNVFHGCGRHGTILQNVSYSTISDNVCTNNTWHGIYLDNADNNTISANICSLNDSGDTATYDGIYLNADSTDNQLTGNHCYGNHRYGVGCDGARNNLSSNICSVNDRQGINLNAVECITDGNFIYDNGQDTAGTYHGINLTGLADRCTVNNNYCNSPGDSQEDNIHLEDGAVNALIVANLCYNGMGDGIELVANNLSCFIICNYLFTNDDYGVSITAASCTDNWVKNNYYSGNGILPILDNGTNTRMHVKSLVFFQGTTIITADGSAKGWEINAEADMAISVEQLPLELQQAVRIKIWAVALGAPVGAGGQMHLDVLFNAGASLEAYNLAANSWTLADFDSEEADYVATNVIHWVIDDGDVGNELRNLLGGDRVELKVNGAAAADPDGATNATFGAVEIEHV